MREIAMPSSLRSRSVIAICLALCVSLGAPAAHAATKSGNRNVPSGLDGVNSPTPVKKPRWTLQDYESAATRTPVVPPDGIYFSRCRFAPFTSTSLYPAFASGESDAIVGDTEFFFADGTSCYQPQNESNIVVNPTDARNIVTSANEYRINGQAVYYSKDGGQTWDNVALPGWTQDTGGAGRFANLDSCGDPVLAFSPDGKRVYFAGLVCNFAGPGNYQVRSGVAVAVSTDGGAHWSAPTMVAYVASGNYFFDKEWMTVGPDGTVWVSWTKFEQTANGKFGGSPIQIASSKDGGMSWSGAKPVSDAAHPYNQGSIPQVAPDGTVYVSYIGGTPDSDYWHDAAIVARSTNGGKSFSNTEVARIYDDLDCYPRQIGAQGRQTLSGEQFRINSFPMLSIDPKTGKLAMVWADNQGRGNCGTDDPTYAYDNSEPTSNQVKLVTSSNGLTWTAPRVLTNSDTADKVFPTVAAMNGRIMVGYYTRSYSPVPTDADNSCGTAYLSLTTGAILNEPAEGPVCLDYAARSSTDDFASETRLSSVSSNPFILFAGSFIGDYTGVALDEDGNGYSVWTDFRGNPGTTTPNQDAVVRVTGTD